MKVSFSYESGILSEAQVRSVTPDQGVWKDKKGGVVIVECPQRIPCNPCATSCPTGAIKPFEDINDTPQVEHALCTGCALCVARCPGLACLVADLTYSEKEAVLKLPFEFHPIPQAEERVDCLNRCGERVADGKVVRVTEPLKDKTRVVWVAVPKEWVMEIRGIRRVKTDD